MIGHKDESVQLTVPVMACLLQGVQKESAVRIHLETCLPIVAALHDVDR